MKFLCIPCDDVMDFSERQLPGDGTFAAVFTCPSCKRDMAMLTNPMETQFVSSMGIKIGGTTIPEQPLALTRSKLEDGRADAFVESRPSRVLWSDQAIERLSNVPSFVRGMVKRIYTDYAREHDISEITPEVMTRARTDLGLEEM